MKGEKRKRINAKSVPSDPRIIGGKPSPAQAVWYLEVPPTPASAALPRPHPTPQQAAMKPGNASRKKEIRLPTGAVGGALKREGAAGLWRVCFGTRRRGDRRGHRHRRGGGASGEGSGLGGKGPIHPPRLRSDPARPPLRSPGPGQRVPRGATGPPRVGARPTWQVHVEQQGPGRAASHGSSAPTPRPRGVLSPAAGEDDGCYYYVLRSPPAEAGREMGEWGGREWGSGTGVGGRPVSKQQARGAGRGRLQFPLRFN